jgi:hypothetical protein
LISSDDARNTYEYTTHYRIAPAFSIHRTQTLDEALKKSIGQVPEGFSLSSDSNPLFLSSREDIKNLIASADV